MCLSKKNQGEATPESLTDALDETLNGEFSELLGDLGNAGLECFIVDGPISKIPAVSAAVSFYKIGSTFRERHQLKQFIVFLETIDRDGAQEDFRKRYRRYFESENHDKELEYLLYILDRLVESDEARMLARLYERLLEGVITFDQLRLFAQAIERLLPGDFETLRKAQVETKTSRATENDSILRLIGLGLMIEAFQRPYVEFEDSGTVIIDPPERAKLEERTYRRTNFGTQLVELICRDHQLQA